MKRECRELGVGASRAAVGVWIMKRHTRTAVPGRAKDRVLWCNTAVPCGPGAWKRMQEQDKQMGKILPLQFEMQVAGG